MILLLLENSGNDQPYCEREDFAVITIPHGSFLRKLRLKEGGRQKGSWQGCLGGALLLCGSWTI